VNPEVLKIIMPKSSMVKQPNEDPENVKNCLGRMTVFTYYTDCQQSADILTGC
jgi:hypothetical protein